MTRLLFALAAFSVAAPIAAHADTYNFVISTGPSQGGSPAAVFQASGTLSGTPSNSMPSALNLTGVTGSAQGYTFTGIAPVGAVKGLSYDNLFYPGTGMMHVDASGVALYMLDVSNPVGQSLAYVYDDGQYHVDVYDPGDYGDGTPFAIESATLSMFTTFSAVPEPSTLALLGSGALGLFGALRRSMRR